MNLCHNYDNHNEFSFHEFKELNYFGNTQNHKRVQECVISWKILMSSEKFVEIKVTWLPVEYG